MAYACDSIIEAEAGGSLRVQRQSGLQQWVLHQSYREKKKKKKAPKYTEMLSGVKGGAPHKKNNYIK